MAAARVGACGALRAGRADRARSLAGGARRRRPPCAGGASSWSTTARRSPTAAWPTARASSRAVRAGAAEIVDPRARRRAGDPRGLRARTRTSGACCRRSATARRSARALEATLDAAPADVIVSGTPIDLAALLAPAPAGGARALRVSPRPASRASARTSTRSSAKALGERRAVKVVIALGGNALAPPAASSRRRHSAPRSRRAAAGDRGDRARARRRGHPRQRPAGRPRSPRRRRPPARASPLDVLGAESEGLIGYLLDQELANALPGRDVAALLTQVEVEPDDPAFTHPTKPIGPAAAPRRRPSACARGASPSGPIAAAFGASSPHRRRARSSSCARSSSSCGSASSSCAAGAAAFRWCATRAAGITASRR